MIPDNYIIVYDTYASSGFWPSTKVTYGLGWWPSWCHWVVYYKDFD